MVIGSTFKYLNSIVLATLDADTHYLSNRINHDLIKYKKKIFLQNSKKNSRIQ